jgi:hypothetical protein
LAAADFDRDGRVDLVETRLNEPAQILWNRTERAGAWIDLELQGTASNRDAIGAWVRVGNQWNRVPASAGYGASPSRVLHFGLGEVGTATGIEIQWPSGKKQTIGPVAAGQRIRVAEPR